MTYYTCPNCGNTTLEVRPVAHDYSVNLQPKKYHAKCFHCKWQTKTYYSRTAISGVITWTLPRYFAFNTTTGYITDYYPKGNPAEYWEPAAISIPPTIENVAVVGLAANAFKDSTVTSMTFPDTLTVMEPGALTNCTGIIALTLPNIGTVPANLAKGSAALATLDMSPLITAVGADAFNGCPLDKITLGADVTIDATDGTMGTNGDFKAEYENGGSLAGTYTYADGTWTLEV